MILTYFSEACDQQFGVIGLCRAAIPAFSYNQAQGKCQAFLYGGCGGNDNRFKTMAECQDTCEKGGNGGTTGRAIAFFNQFKSCLAGSMGRFGAQGVGIFEK